MLLPCPAAEEDSPDSSVSSVADDSQGAGAKTDGPAADALLEAEYAGSSSSSEDESAEQSNSESDGDAVEAPGCLTQDRLAATAAKELATEGADRDNEGTALGSGETASKQEQDVGVAASAQPADAATVAAPAACELSEQATEAERQALPAQAVASGRTAAPAAAVEADGSDVPFTLPAPETYEAFRLLVEGRSSQHLALVVQRICAFNAAALAAENRRKMQVSQACFTPVAQTSRQAHSPALCPKGSCAGVRQPLVGTMTGAWIVAHGWYFICQVQGLQRCWPASAQCMF